jgi:4a-hydroxytetrahydrobiopterin dehydratase
MGETPGRHGLLGSDEIEERLPGLTGWRVEDGALVKTFTFTNFVSAVAFVDRLTFAAEAQNHHPDLEVAWGKVTARLRSHDAGGITARDFRLAAALDGL